MTRALILMFVLSVSTSALAQGDPAEQGGTVWFFYPDEEPSPLGKPMLLHVNILTRQLATIGPGEYFGYPVPAGIHAFSYTRAPSRDEYLGLSIKPGQDVYVEVHFRDLKIVSPEEGRLAVKQSRPISVLNVIDRSVIVVGAPQLFKPPDPPAVAVVREIPAPKPPPPSMVLLPPVGKSAPATLVLAPQGQSVSPAPTLPPQPGLQKEPQKETAHAAPPQTSSFPLINATPPQKADVSTPGNVPPQRTTPPQVAAVTPPPAPSPAPPQKPDVSTPLNVPSQRTTPPQVAAATPPPAPSPAPPQKPDVSTPLNVPSQRTTPPQVAAATPPPAPSPAPPQKPDVSTPLNVPPQRTTPPQVAAATPPRATPPPPMLSTNESFPKARLSFLIDGTKREVDAVVTLDQNALIVTDRRDRSVLKMFSYPNIRGAEYAFARSPKWKTPVLGNVFFLDPKTKKHWFMVRTSDDYALIELDSDNSNLVLEAFEIRAGRKVETVEDSR